MTIAQSDIPSDAPSIAWAKLKRPDPSGTPSHWLPLIDHSADVAAVFEAILEQSIIRSRLACLAGRSELDAITSARLCAYVALHDFGKAHRNFYRRWWRHDLHSGHCSEALAALIDPKLKGRVASALPLEKMQRWGAWELAIPTILAHHGRPIPIEAPDRVQLSHWQTLEAYDPITQLIPLGDAVQRWFAPAFGDTTKTLPTQQGFWHAVAGLVTLADWIGSNETLFPLITTDQSTSPTRIDQARNIAPAALARVGFCSRQFRDELSNTQFSAISPHLPRSIQLATGTQLHARRLVLESETGSGKTEAALYRFLKLFAAGDVDGLYFALPTRVAATSLYQRIVQAVAQIFPDTLRPEVVLAVPGAQPQRLSEPSPIERIADVWEEQKTIAISPHWASERSKTFLAGTIAVGTIDQALLSIIRAKHAHLRLACLARHLLVVDEVHASDAYMISLLDQLLRFHTKAGGHALLLSATLGGETRARLLKQPRPNFESAIAAAYPALASEHDDRPQGHAWEGREKRIHISLCSDISDAPSIARRAIDAARKGAKVLVIRNLRKDAIAVFEALQSMAPDDPSLFRCCGIATLHHGRFAREDRTLLDQAVETQMGRNRRPGGLVLIGTQTIEIALDLDSDLLITDLSPADVLLQRLGRLHRHVRDHRPAGFETPRALVLAPQSLDLLLEKPAHGLGGEYGPYRDLLGLEATRQLIETQPEWVIPKMNRFLVESALHSEARDKVLLQLTAKNQNWNKHISDYEGSGFAKAKSAEQACIDLNADISARHNLFPDDVTFGTRLGARDLIVTLPDNITGPFGNDIRVISIPHDWTHGIDKTGTISPQVTYQGDQLLIHIQDLAFSYDARGLMQAGR